MSLVLIVEDDDKIASNVIFQLREEGYGAVSVRSAEEAESWLLEPANPEPDLLLLDVRLPGISGIEWLRRSSDARRMLPTILISGEALMAETVEAIRLGVYDFLDKPFGRERLLKSVANGLEHAALRIQVEALRALSDRDGQIFGESAPVRTLRNTIESLAVTDARVLIRGESGTGKELVANALHRLSRRAGRAFVKLNCAAIPTHLIEDELFGHVRGAFTDAKNAKPGLFEEADGGTLFLDEIGDMDLALQSRLLRVLEDGNVRRIGATHDAVVDVRVIAATHRDLEELVASGRFREDLYFRLSAVPIDVPPLRARREDILLLFSTFLHQFCRKNRRGLLSVDGSASATLRGYDWPGNVRELRNLAERLSVFGADPITVDQLPSSLVSPRGRTETGLMKLADATAIVPLRLFKSQSEKEYIESVLQRADWNVSRAAQLLEIQRTHLHQKIVALGIVRPEAATSDGLD